MSGRIINISGLNPIEDPSYRYRMPPVVGKIEGKGNGIKTVIVNISDLALALKRDPAEVNKFFGCEMGAQTTYNEADDRAVVNGAHTDVELQQCVHKYIEKFVLCPSCGLPETIYSIKHKEWCVWHRCAACGAKETVDMNHKLCAFIFAQDKKKKAEEKLNKKKASKEGKDKDSDDDKKKSKKDKKKKKDKGSDDEKKDKKKKDKKKKDKKKKDKKDKDSVGSLGDDMDQLSVGSDVIDDDVVRDLAIQGVQSFMKNNPDASDTEVAEVVINQQMASALKSQDKIHIFLRAFITPKFFSNQEIEKNASIMQKITQGNPIMQRHLISAIEGVNTSTEGLEPKFFPVMLKQMFDEDLLEEKVILDWAFDGRSEYTLDSVTEDQRANLRGQAEPVITWLQGDSDSDSDSGSDSD
eukprot:CAMPEP_0197243180 /NCGR_PEP_ID=MMETSP1429-20130617/8702_1 /TAXON_ID=49237 /ORGANISM="Chaetoceros  sp., Strain UNC1202" /LENGTH=410 /DNA_ID=CAMNT_0042703341 /DNA_START=398 /DNA_END=1630 /DNA_ORIENTATION=+